MAVTIASPAPINAIPVHSLADSRSPKTHAELDERDHGDREHVERRRARRQHAQDGDPQQKADRGRHRAHVDEERSLREAPARIGKVDADGEERQRHHAEQHLPRREVQHVELPPLLVVLRRDGPRRPAEARKDRPEPRREIAAPVPRLDDEREPGERGGDREPLQAAHALVQHRPCDQQRPERHREHEHRRAPGAAARERHRRRQEVDRRLEEAGDEGGYPVLRAAVGLGGRTGRRTARRRRPTSAAR